MSRKSEGHLDNEKKILIVIVACVGLVAVGGVGLFAIQFAQYGLSSSTSDWANFGSFVGGILGPLLSLLTIFYMVWSFKKQTALMQKQMEKDRERDERDMLMKEINQLADKFESCCLAPAEMGEIAENFLRHFLANDKELDSKNFKVIDRYTARVENTYFYGGTICALRGLEEKRGLDVVKEFLEESKERQIEYRLRQADVAMARMAMLSFKALEKGVRTDVLQSIFIPFYQDVKTLFGWGYMAESTVFSLNLFLEIPFNPFGWEDDVQKMFVDDFCCNHGFKGEEHRFEFNMSVDEGSIEEMAMVDGLTGDRWCRACGEEWKKAS